MVLYLLMVAEESCEGKRLPPLTGDDPHVPVDLPYLMARAGLCIPNPRHWAIFAPRVPTPTALALSATGVVVPSPSIVYLACHAWIVVEILLATLRCPRIFPWGPTSNKDGSKPSLCDRGSYPTVSGRL